MIGNAVRVPRIAPGEEADDTSDDGKRAAAERLKKRAADMSPERRVEIAKKAAESRWKR